MVTILVSGWNVGFQKIGSTKLLQRELGYSLSQAKGATDALLNGSTVEVQVSGERARSFVELMSGLGAQCAAAAYAHHA